MVGCIDGMLAADAAEYWGNSEEMMVVPLLLG
jgi:hypothetical protein